jgi:hypothetical protein
MRNSQFTVFSFNHYLIGCIFGVKYFMQVSSPNQAFVEETGIRGAVMAPLEKNHSQFENCVGYEYVNWLIAIPCNILDLVLLSHESLISLVICKVRMRHSDEKLNDIENRQKSFIVRNSDLKESQEVNFLLV